MSVNMATWELKGRFEKTRGEVGPSSSGNYSSRQVKDALNPKRTPFSNILVHLRLKQLRFIILRVLEVKTLS